MSNMTSEFCHAVPSICEKMDEGFFDFHEDIDNKDRVADKAAHGPAGSGWRNLIHYAQIIKSKNFQRYDYGNKEENNVHYGQDYPPSYDLSKIEIPMAFASGDVDQLATPTDVNWLLD